MPRRFEGVAPGAVLGIVLVALSYAPSVIAESLAKRLQGSAAESYRAPDPWMVERATNLFAQHFRGEFEPQHREIWHELGFRLLLLGNGKVAFAVIEEAPGSRRGRGFFVFRLCGAKGLAIQAPHQFKDLDTGLIATQLFEQYPFHAAAWNTAPRNTQADSDLAHQTMSYLQAFTQAFARHYPQGYLLQVHGFSSTKRRTKKGAEAGIILSSGSRNPSSAAAELQSCLQRRLSDRVYLYPRDAEELGGTTNSQGRALRSQGHDGFLHMEVSRSLRKRLGKEPTLRQNIWDCLSFSSP